MRIGVISDTHIPVRAPRLPPEVLEIFQGVDAILHAGDLLEGSVLDELARLARTYAVLGNNDDRLVGALPECRRLDLEGVAVGMIHDSGLS
ncbi:MAG: metallophosphoesterase family protein, partial [Actinomycetota bacterium]